MFSVALSLGLLPVGVSHHLALWSSDFPHCPHIGGSAAASPSCGSHWTDSSPPHSAASRMAHTDPAQPPHYIGKARVFHFFC